MKILRLLNKKKFLITIFIVFFIPLKIESNEPIDIWDLDLKKENLNSEDKKSQEKKKDKNQIYINQENKNIYLKVEEDETLLSKNSEIFGLYDPEANGLNIDMWSNSDGKQILKIINRINEMELSEDAKEILNISLLTNSYIPQKNITKEEFIKFKSDFLMKNEDLKLIENFLLKNQNLDSKIDQELIKFIVDDYLSKSKIEESCEIFSLVDNIIIDDYLFKFNVYCLINKNKKDEAQMQFDLKKELGFKDIFFENKFNHLMGYIEGPEKSISDKSVLDFHLSHRTDPEFKFEPNSLTSQKIWRYLSTSNLLDSIQNVDLEDLSRIAIIEKATHEGNYKEENLYELYKRFQFNIDQLLNVKQSYKVLVDAEARALLYQGILITNKIDTKMELIETLKNSFAVEGIQNSFKTELLKILSEINPDDIPSNYSNFYERHSNKEKTILTKTKVNNKIIHQSKLLNYFRNSSKSKNINQETNDLLKKIKKNKKYFVSTKDIMLLESLKSDGINISKKYKNLYEVDESGMPEDIQSLIDNNEVGLFLLRLVEIIGEDELHNIGPETLYFIISALNQLDIDPLRNKILLTVLPLKV